jgi:hypothetical protein
MATHWCPRGAPPPGLPLRACAGASCVLCRLTGGVVADAFALYGVLHPAEAAEEKKQSKNRPLRRWLEKLGGLHVRTDTHGGNAALTLADVAWVLIRETPAAQLTSSVWVAGVRDMMGAGGALCVAPQAQAPQAPPPTQVPLRAPPPTASAPAGLPDTDFHRRAAAAIDAAAAYVNEEGRLALRDASFRAAMRDGSANLASFDLLGPQGAPTQLALRIRLFEKLAPRARSGEPETLRSATARMLAWAVRAPRGCCCCDGGCGGGYA